jgi:hypothetical protein
MKQILRNGEGNPWADGGERRVGHHIAPERFHEGDPWILAATTPVRTPLVISFRLERYAEPLNPTWIAGLVELDAGNTYPGKIALRHEPWKKVQMSVRATNGSRIQNAFGFLWVAGFRLHEHPQALQLKVAHGFSLRQAMIVSITRHAAELCAG